jgi:hypothetical protein
LQCFFSKQILTKKNPSNLGHPEDSHEQSNDSKNLNKRTYQKLSESYFENSFIVVKMGEEKIHFYLDNIEKYQHFYSTEKRVYKYVKRRSIEGDQIPLFAYMVRLKAKEWPNFYLHLFLDELGKSFELPQGNYFYGQEKPNLSARNQRVKDQVGSTLANNDKEILWDNYGRTIWIDTHLVTNQETNDYFLVKGEENELIVQKEKWSFPATHLSLDQQKQFCHFYGKELLTAPLFDAATFYKMEKTEDAQRSIYNWGKTDVQQLSKKKEDRCRFILAAECTLNEESVYSPDNISWSGFFQSMGGFQESFLNPFVPYYNIKISSHLLPMKSKYHFLGLRFNWNGKKYPESEIETVGFSGEELKDLKDNMKKMGVAFRCYKENDDHEK